MGSFAKNFPQITTQPIDPNTGCWTTEWYLFLIKLFQSTGGATGFDPSDIESTTILAGAGGRGVPSVHEGMSERALIDPAADLVHLRDEIATVKRYRTPLLKLTKTTYAALSLIQVWAGAIVDIPAGWALCNGAAGTPDLRDRFVIGAGGAYAVDATGGSTTIAANNLPAHTHNYDRATANTTNLLYTVGATSLDPVTTLTETPTASAANATTAAPYLQPYYAKAYIINTAVYTVVTNVTLDD